MGLLSRASEQEGVPFFQIPETTPPDGHACFCHCPMDFLAANFGIVFAWRPLSIVLRSYPTFGGFPCLTFLKAWMVLKGKPKGNRGPVWEGSFISRSCFLFQKKGDSSTAVSFWSESSRDTAKGPWQAAGVPQFPSSGSPQMGVSPNGRQPLVGI